MPLWRRVASQRGAVRHARLARPQQGGLAARRLGVERLEDRCLLSLGPDYVIHVVFDGLRPDAITTLGPTDLPNVYRMIDEGSWTGNARADYDRTETLPDHTDMLTSRPVAGSFGHGVDFNSDNGSTVHDAAGEYVTSVFDVVHDNGLRTGLYASKSKFAFFDRSWNAANGRPDPIGPDDGPDKIDVYTYNSNTSALKDSFLADMAADPFNYAMISFRDPDSTGHSNGWMSTEYLDAVKTCDGYLGEIFAMIDGSPTLDVHTAVILSADHGGTGTSHGTASNPLNYTIPLLVWGPGVTAGGDLYTMNPDSRQDPATGRPDNAAAPQPIRNGDGGNLATALLGLGPIDDSFFNAAHDLVTGWDYGEIHGSKFEDLDGDGVWDKDGPGAEPGLPGVTVFLDLDRDGRLDTGEPNTVTAADGSYAFTGLEPGDYEVAELLEPGWVQTYPTPPNVLYAVATPYGSQADYLVRIENYATDPVAVLLGQTHVPQDAPYARPNLGDIAVDPTSGTIFGVSWDYDKLYEVDPKNAEVRWYGAYGAPDGETALEFDADGRLYSWGCNEKLHEVNPLTGTKTWIGESENNHVGYGAAGNLAFDGDGNLYGIGHLADPASYNWLIKINPDDGTSTTIGHIDEFDGGDNATGLEIDDGTLYVVLGHTNGDPADLYTIDPVTAQPTLIGPIANSENLYYWGLSFVRPAAATGGAGGGPNAPASSPPDATAGFDWTGWQAIDVSGNAANAFEAGNVAASGFAAEVHYTFQGTPAIDASGAATAVALDGERTWESPGDPILPLRSSTILLPQGQTVASVEVDFGEGVPIAEGVQLTAATGAVPMTEAGLALLDAGAGEPQLAASFLEDRAVSWSAHTVCGYSIATINVFPVQYDAADGRLTYYDDIMLRVTTAPMDSQSVLPVRDSAVDRARVAGMVDNDSVLSSYQPTAGEGSDALPPGGPFEYVIVTSSDLESEFQPLITQKLSRGLSATIVTTEYIYANYTGMDYSDNAGKLREFIADAYANWNTTWVLLGGDTDVVPYRGGYGRVPEGLNLQPLGDYVDNRIPTDLYFSALDGPWDGNHNGVFGESTDGTGGGDVDLVADVFIGRAPVGDTTQAANFVAKTVKYETEPHPNPNWAVLLAENLDAETDGSYSMIPIRNGTLPGDWDVTERYDSVDGWGPADVIADLNASPHIVYHLGHANVSYNAKLQSSDVDALENVYPYFMYSQGCESGAFERWDAIAEHHVYDDHGAFAVVMNSRYGWYLPGEVPDASHHWHYEFSDALLNERLIHVGQTNQDSKDDNLWRVGSIGAERWIHFELNLLGDPETPFQVSTAGKGTHSIQVGYGEVIEGVNFGNRWNNPPTAGDDAFTVVADGGTTRLDVLANDTTAPDPGEPLRITSVTMPSQGGTATIVAGIRIDYTPAPDFVGTETFSYAIGDGNPGGDAAATVTITVNPAPTAQVVGRHVFYNRSAWDGNDAAANANDDDAIHPAPPVSDPTHPDLELGKQALLPGETASFVNYTSYFRGINGIMVDFSELSAVPTVDDFEFKVGNDDTPSNWVPAPDPIEIALRQDVDVNGDGTPDVDRVTIIWEDYYVQGGSPPYQWVVNPNGIGNQWLQVTVLATPNTGLADPDVFYFGNAIGEAGNSTVDAIVNATDEIDARMHPHFFLDPAPVYDPVDFNRDKRVDATDQIHARYNQTFFLTDLNLITVPGEPLGGLAATGGPTSDREPAAARIDEAALFDAAFGEPDTGRTGLAAASPTTRTADLTWLDGTGSSDARGRFRIADPARTTVEKLLATL